MLNFAGMKGQCIDIRDQELKDLKNWKIDTTFILRQNFQRIDELEKRTHRLEFLHNLQCLTIIILAITVSLCIYWYHTTP